MAQSPEQFAKKLNRAATDMKRVQSKAIGARAQVTKRYILAAARSQTRQVKPGWVQYGVKGDVARLQLRGGMAHLTELGSYKKPEGWDETPKSVTARRIKSAAKKGVTLSEHQALNTPWGPKASVHHPALKKRPFWRKGIDASRKPGHNAYQKVVNETFVKALH